MNAIAKRHRFTNRYTVLISFTILAGISQMLWLNFAPLITMLETTYHVTESDINWLLIVFPLIYVLLSIHAGIVIDRKGYRFGIGIGGLIMAIFACVRIMDYSFMWLLIGQIGIAIGQPYVINGISKLVVDWFGQKQQAMATGVGTVGMFAGMALALAGTPIIVDKAGLQMTMVIFAVITIVSAVFFALVAYPKPLNKLNKQMMSESDGISWRDYIPLLRNRQLLLISVIALLALGFFNGLTSWLEPILKPNGIDAEGAGLIGGMLIIGGIVGSSIIPGISDKLGTMKPFLWISCLISIVLVYLICTMDQFMLLLILGAVLGFIFLPGYALLLSYTERLAGERHAGEATGLIMLTGNLGGVLVILTMQLVKGDSDSWINSVYLMMGLLVLCVILALNIKERRSAPLKINHKRNTHSQ
ncbi:MFS transporter [Paenibacillus dokdonensis]|uniref:MFS transporter n=1 Tax=Paenibacillus dokdonensis TaxID=2567944 RepID=UPI0010A834C9|nr:MFS transporter [Paenibacillus dokdonensis]